MEKVIMSLLSSPAITERPAAGRAVDPHHAGPLAAIAAVPSGEQDRLLWEHGEKSRPHAPRNQQPPPAAAQRARHAKRPVR
jgi:hypothetical protein